MVLGTRNPFRNYQYSNSVQEESRMFPLFDKFGQLLEYDDENVAIDDDTSIKVSPAIPVSLGGYLCKDSIVLKELHDNHTNNPDPFADKTEIIENISPLVTQDICRKTSRNSSPPSGSVMELERYALLYMAGNKLDDLPPDTDKTHSESENVPSCFLVLTGVPLDSKPNDIREVSKKYGTIEAIDFSQDGLLGKVIIKWQRIENATLAYLNIGSDILKMTGATISASYLSISESDELSTIYIRASGQDSSVDEDLALLIEEKFKAIGDIKFYRSKNGWIMCTFHKIESVTQCISLYNGCKIIDSTIHLYTYKDFELGYGLTKINESDKPKSSIPSIRLAKTINNTKVDIPFNGYAHTTMKPGYLPNLKYNENTVNIERILSGQDKRLTLMLRNIPNKINQQVLKDYIDVTNEYTYDFLYLRIDFSNRCNVGYAFISFTSPEHIVTFAKARVGTKWNLFNSDKICGISYANIQGTDSLIEKFRNSSVMEQNPSFRPKLYHTEGLLQGHERPFPTSN